MKNSRLQLSSQSFSQGAENAVWKCYNSSSVQIQNKNTRSEEGTHQQAKMIFHQKLESNTI